MKKENSFQTYFVVSAVVEDENITHPEQVETTNGKSAFEIVSKLTMK